MARDYHAILGVDESATLDQLKKAYRRQALLHHPDKNSEPDAVRKFQEINEAYQILSETIKKQELAFDIFAEDVLNNRGGGGDGHGGRGSSSSGNDANGEQSDNNNNNNDNNDNDAKPKNDHFYHGYSMPPDFSSDESDGHSSGGHGGEGRDDDHDHDHDNETAEEEEEEGPRSRPADLEGFFEWFYSETGDGGAFRDRADVNGDAFAGWYEQYHQHQQQLFEQYQKQQQEQQRKKREEEQERLERLREYVLEGIRQRQLEREREEQEQREQERREDERRENERRENERKEQDRKELERKEQERRDQERKEQERKERERMERRERERREQERKEQEWQDQERKDQERRERQEWEREEERVRQRQHQEEQQRQSQQPSSSSSSFESASEKPPPKVHPLVVTLEELLTGATKRFNIKRQLQPGSTRLPEKILSVVVKPGWKAGTKIKFTNEGDECPAPFLLGGALIRDIEFVLEEAPHAHFTRKGDNLHATIELSMVEALTGFAKFFKCLDGVHSLIATSIPFGNDAPRVIQPGEEQVFPSEGMPMSKMPGKRGDLIVTYVVKLPEHVSPAQSIGVKKLFEQSGGIKAPSQ